MTFKTPLARLALLAGLAALFTSTAAVADVEKVSEVEVTSDVSAIQNERAASYWANVATDIQTAILERVADRIAEDGARIRVDIRGIELANAFERAFSLSDAAITGQINVTDPADPSNDNAYELRVSLENAQVSGADGQPMVFTTIETPEAYRALVDGFADNLVARLD